MPTPPAELAEIAQQLKKGFRPQPVSVRTLLSWFSQQRRGIYVIEAIRQALSELGLDTSPDFESAYIDATIEFTAQRARSDAMKGATTSAPLADPTVRIGMLDAANRAPICVSPEAPVREAVTLMLAHEFSQLPVMAGERHVKGMISWKSLGRRMALGLQPKVVKDCTEPHHEVSYSAPLFAALEVIVQHDYALVRGPQNTLTGLVTTSDLSTAFRALAQPYLLTAEIENHIRRLIYGRFTPEEIMAAKDDKDEARPIAGIASLSLGEYARLLETKEHWERVGINLDRGSFLRALHNVRRIRNEVMHFTPDGITPADLQALKDFVGMMQALREMGVP